MAAGCFDILIGRFCNCEFRYYADDCHDDVSNMSNVLWAFPQLESLNVCRGIALQNV